MKSESKRRTAMVTTELAIGIGLTVIALFIAIALLYQPLSDMIINTNFKNMFKNDSEKTGFSSYNRDYTESQINVQITGAQGLEMLRKKANNKALDLIKEDFSTNNTSGLSIAYLATAVNVITGEPHICTYMKKDSNEPCSKLGGYNYKTTIDSSKITLTQVDPKTNTVIKTIAININNSTLGSILSSVKSNTSARVGTNSADTISTKQKYETIFTLTEELLNELKPGVPLVNIVKTTNTQATDVTALDKIPGLKTDLKTMFATTLVSTLNDSHKYCTKTGSLSGHDYDWPNGKNGCNGGGHLPSYEFKHFLFKDDIKEYKNHAVVINKAIDATKTSNATALLNEVINNETFSKIIYIIQKDSARGESKTCTTLINNLQLMKETYGAEITIPSCKTYPWD